MKVIRALLGGLPIFLLSAATALAATDSTITTYTSDTLKIITVIAAAGAAFFLIKGGYLYIVSTGKPDVLEHAKKTIRNALIGLVLILGAAVLVNILTGAFTPSPTTNTTSTITLVPIDTPPPSSGAVQFMIDTLNGFMQNIVQGATKPVVDAIIGFLTSTPSVLQNSTIHNFWLVMLGITDSLYILVVALLGLHFMSAATFGFEEMELKQLLPRIGLSFLGSNMSLYLSDYVITTNNILVGAVLKSTGGLAHAWIVNAITVPSLLTGTYKIVTLLFFVLFLIVAIVLLLLYVSRLILIALAAVLSPFIFLLWAIPKTSDFAEIAVKVYFVTVFVEFVHVVVIQLASSFLSFPDHKDNSLLAIVIAIGLFTTLLKIPSLMTQMVFYTSRNGTFKKIGGQIVNVIGNANNTNKTGNSGTTGNEQHGSVKTPRRTVNA